MRTLPIWNNAMSDGCTFAPDRGWWGSHREACVWHDRTYRLGGHKQRRLVADRTFRVLLIRLGMPRFIAGIYYRAVRAFGHPRFRRPHSWAYGGERFQYDDRPAIEVSE